MVDEWWRRRRRWFFEDLFREFEEMIRDLERTFREFEEYDREFIERWSRDFKGKPLIWGYRVEIGPDGVPRVEYFGNVKRKFGKPVVTEEREPIIDVFEDEETITVLAELPGVSKDKINVEVSEDKRKLYIKASDTNRKYYKEVDLPSPVDPESAKAEYRNGILEVKLKKTKKETKGYSIKID